MHSELTRHFESLAKEFLARHPGIRHEWRVVKSIVWDDRLDLVCAPNASNEVFATLRDHKIVIGPTKGDHDDFEDLGRGLSEHEVAREAFERFVEVLGEQGQLTREA